MANIIWKSIIWSRICLNIFSLPFSFEVLFWFGCSASFTWIRCFAKTSLLFTFTICTHRFNILEVLFLQSQRTGLLEAKISQQSNFNLDLPSISEYLKLPTEVCRSAPFSSASNKEIPGGSSSDQLQPEEDDYVCHCGLLPVLHTIQAAAGADFGRQFFSCIQKEE